MTPEQQAQTMRATGKVRIVYGLVLVAIGLYFLGSSGIRVVLVWLTVSVLAVLSVVQVVIRHGDTHTTSKSKEPTIPTTLQEQP